MNFVVSTAPATEPLTIAEAKTFCRLDDTNAEPSPGKITVALAAAGAGNLDNGAHRYLATFVTADGETSAGVVSDAVTVADKTTNGQVSLTQIPLGGSAVTARKIYRTVAGGSTYLLLTTIADNTTTTYVDNTADSALGAGVPNTNTTGDPILSILVASARAKAQVELGRYLVTQTVDLYLDAFPCGQNSMYDIRLPPTQSVSAITYTDINGNVQTLDPTLYTVDVQSVPARIFPVYGSTWPSTRPVPNAVKVRFIAGYGAAAAVPTCVKQWMLLQVKAGWDNRDALVVGPTGLVALPSSYVDGLLDPERVYGRLLNE